VIGWVLARLFEECRVRLGSRTKTCGSRRMDASFLPLREDGWKEVGG
jgi:hypothetical protein